MIHDQITYTISPEYFTRMKFDQFRSADFGFPTRVLVAEIGFLATWWVGLVGTWFMARLVVGKFDQPEKELLKALLFISGVTVTFSVIGYFAGPGLLGNRSGWEEALRQMEVTDTNAFHRVAAIHLGSYTGALLGWAAAMLKYFIQPAGITVRR